MIIRIDAAPVSIDVAAGTMTLEVAGQAVTFPLSLAARQQIMLAAASTLIDDGPPARASAAGRSKREPGDATRAKVLEHVATHGPATNAQLTAAYGWKPSKLGRALRALVASGELLKGAGVSPVYTLPEGDARAAAAADRARMPVVAEVAEVDAEAEARRRKKNAKLRRDYHAGRGGGVAAQEAGKAIAAHLRAAGEALPRPEIARALKLSAHAWTFGVRVAMAKYGVHRAMAGGPPTARYATSKARAEKASRAAFEAWRHNGGTAGQVKRKAKGDDGPPADGSTVH